MLHDLIGLVGACSLAICGFFQARKSWKTRDFNGTSVWFISLWILGDLLSIIYIRSGTKGETPWPLLADHIPGIICAITIGALWFSTWLSKRRRRHSKEVE